jgi:hypothetical protein
MPVGVVEELAAATRTRAGKGPERLFSSGLLRLFNPQTFPVSVSVGELDSSSLQSPFDCLYGFVGNNSSFLFKVDDSRQAELRSARELGLGNPQQRTGSPTLSRRH